MAAVGEDDAAWERAISAATKATSAPKTLALDGIVKSSTGRLPSAALLERFAASLEELSVAGARLSSLEGLPRLPALRRLSLPDNRLLGAAALAAVAVALQSIGLRAPTETELGEAKRRKNAHHPCPRALRIVHTRARELELAGQGCVRVVLFSYLFPRAPAFPTHHTKPTIMYSNS